MLKGFSVPRSPLGAAALVPPPPWHLAGNVLAVEYWSDPDLSANILPGEVELDARGGGGHAVAVFTDYQFTARDEEHLDPSRYQSRAFVVLLDAMWRGKPIAWCPYAYCDNDAALLRGWISGYPHKLGSIHQTRSFAAHNAASPRLAEGSSFAACVSAHGQLLAQARIRLREKVDRLTGFLDRPVLTRRYFPQVSEGGSKGPVIDEIVRSVIENVSQTNIWVGDGELAFPEVFGEELDILAPIRVERGAHFSFSYSTSGYKVLADLAV